MKIETSKSFGTQSPKDPVELNTEKTEIRSTASLWGRVLRFFKTLNLVSKTQRQQASLDAFRKALSQEYGPLAAKATRSLEGRQIRGRDIQTVLDEVTLVLPQVRQENRQHNQFLIEHHMPAQWRSLDNLEPANLRDPRNLCRSLLEGRVSALSAQGLRRLVSDDVGSGAQEINKRLQLLTTPEQVENAHRAFKDCTAKMRQLLSIYSSGGMDSGLLPIMQDLNTSWHEVVKAFNIEHHERIQMDSRDSIALSEALLGQAMGQLEDAQQRKVYARLREEDKTGMAFTLGLHERPPTVDFMGYKLLGYSPGGKWDDPKFDKFAKQEMRVLLHEKRISDALSDPQYAAGEATGAAGTGLLEVLTRGRIHMESDANRSELGEQRIRSIAGLGLQAMARLESEDDARVARQVMNFLSLAYQNMLNESNQENRQMLNQAIEETAKAFKLNLSRDGFALLSELKRAAMGMALQSQQQLTKADAQITGDNKGLASVTFNEIEAELAAGP